MESVISSAREELIKILSSADPPKKWIRNAKILLQIIEKVSGATMIDEEEDFGPEVDAVFQPDGFRPMRAGMGRAGVVGGGNYGDILSMLDIPLRGQAQRHNIESRVSLLKAVLDDKGRSEEEHSNARKKIDELLKSLDDIERSMAVPLEEIARQTGTSLEDAVQGNIGAILGSVASGEIDTTR